MDKEQINELKPGDEILIRGRFEKIKENGDYSISYLLTTVHDKLYMYKAAVHPSAVIIKSPPKHDPCRLFKKGDKVRVVERNGRKFWDYDPKTIYTVVANEYSCDDQNVLHQGCVGINDGNPQTGSAWNIPFFHIELVTPVEELEPYYVKDDGTHYVVGKRPEEPEIVYLAEYSKDRHPHAKAAAEAERDRLNAEYRKEATHEA